MTDEILIYGGSGLKTLDNGKVGGYLVTFGNADQKDLEGDYFTKSTDFGDAIKTAVWFNHRLPLATKTGQLTIKEKIGDGEITVDDTGVFIEAVLYNRSKYEAVLDSLGWSSGTAAHLVERKSTGEITHWPLGLDASLTPMPAEPRNRAMPLKSLIPADEPEGAGDAPAQEPIKNNQPQIIVKEIPMSEEIKDVAEQMPETPQAVGYEEFKALSASVNQILDHLTSEPKYKRVGYIAPDSEDDHAHVKSFADYLVAVRRGNTKRLAEVYRSVKDMSGETGSGGGFLVPQEYMTELLKVGDESAGIVSRVKRVPVSAPSGQWPALDQYITPTAGSGNTAFSAGVKPVTTAEGAAYSEGSDPAFKMLQWRVSKIGDVVDVPNELLDDSGLSIETLLRSLFGVAINNKLEHYIIRGTGAGEPLGIMNASAAVAVTTATDNTFAEADALSMLSRFKSVGGQPVWIMHRGVIPDFANFTASNVDMVDWRQGISGALLGYPVLFSEHSPQDDNAGDVILADLSAYLLFDRQQLTIDYSEHAKFENDLTVWRFKTRMDGMPWLKSSITLADPQGSYTVSPFVYHND